MGPYGIAQVDVPGLIGVYQGAQDRRRRQMLDERAIAAEDRAIARSERLTSIYSRVARPGQTQTRGGDPNQPPGGVAAPYAGQPQGQAAPPAAMDVGGMPAPQASAPIATAYAPQQTYTELNRDLIGEAMTVDPAEAKQLQAFFSEMDAPALAAAKQRAEVIGQAALIADTPEKWDALIGELSVEYPDLAAMRGKFSLPARQAAITKAGLVKEYIAQTEEKFQAIPEGGALVNVRDPAAVREFQQGQGAAGPRLRPGDPPSPAAIDMLRQDPSTAAAFDERFGKGAARRALDDGGAGSADPRGFP